MSYQEKFDLIMSIWSMVGMSCCLVFSAPIGRFINRMPLSENLWFGAFYWCVVAGPVAMGAIITFTVLFSPVYALFGIKIAIERLIGVKLKLE